MIHLHSVLSNSVLSHRLLLRRPVLRRYCYILIDLLRSTVTPRHVLLDKGEELSSLSRAFVEARPSWTCLRKNPEEKVSELCETVTSHQEAKHPNFVKKLKMGGGPHQLEATLLSENKCCRAIVSDP